MKKILLFSLFVLTLLPCKGTAETIASFPRKGMFIERMVFSPDGRQVALQARDRANYFRRTANLYIGSSQNGRFKKISNHSVSHITWIDNQSVVFRDKGTGSIFRNRNQPAIVIKAINIRSRQVRTLYSLPAKTIPGSGGRTEVTNLFAISPGARNILIQIGKRYIIENMTQHRSVTLQGFTVPYSSNPGSEVRFFGQNGVILFDGRGRRYMIYSYDGKGIRLQQTISKISGLQPSGDFMIDNEGKFILFAAEVCRGGCRNEIYKYNLQTKQLGRKLLTVRGTRVLRLVFSEQQNQVLVNDFHQWLKRYRLPAR